MRDPGQGTLDRCRVQNEGILAHGDKVMPKLKHNCQMPLCG
jgi:hypothetical protein